jgi:hypothetical protein
MKLTWRLCLGIAWALGFVIWTGPIQAGDDFKVEPGYSSLFNGKDLTGWRLGKDLLDGKTETKNKKWHVTDNVIVIDGGGGGDIYTSQDFNKDYNLKLEFRAAPKADSGVYIRGIQLQVRDYPTVGPYKKVKFKDGDWNQLDITVKGPVYTATVNGKTVGEKDLLEVTVKDGKPTVRLNGAPLDISTVAVSAGAVAECKCNGEVIEKTFKVGVKGGIGLQSETGKFEFRRLRIKELP